MIRVVCDCGRVFKAEDRHAGKRTKCPVCGTSLTIGQATVPSSSGGDIEDVPSWWYPTDSEGQAPPGPKSGQGGRKSDALATTVFNSNPDLAHLNVQGNHSRLPIPADGSQQTSSRSISRVRRLWASRLVPRCWRYWPWEPSCGCDPTHQSAVVSGPSPKPRLTPRLRREVPTRTRGRRNRRRPARERRTVPRAGPLRPG